MSRQEKNDNKEWQNNYQVGRRMHTIMSVEEASNGKKSYWPELEITGTICNLSPALWRMHHLTSLYLNDNNLSEVPGEISLLSSLIHLDLSCNKIRRLPPEIGDLQSLKDLLINNNYLRLLPYELGRLFQLHTLNLKGNPLAQEFSVVYNEPNGTQKLITYLLDNLRVTTPQPPQRPWISLAAPDRTRPTFVFTVMCYNILCDKYATRQLYGYCPNWALSWECRRKGIMEEINLYGADIICLQEVETEQFYQFFLPELKKDNYEGIFSPKSRAKTMSKNDRKHVDGCAIFYKGNKFTMMRHYLFEFNQLAMLNAEGSDHMLNRVMTKDNIGLACLLQPKDDRIINGHINEFGGPNMCKPILVCTAHIHWDPEFCDVKLIQTMMLMHELQSIVEDATQNYNYLSKISKKLAPSAIPLILCGDFNSLPDSGVFELLSAGHISSGHGDFKGLGYKDCLRKLSSTIISSSSASAGSIEYTHPFKLTSAYSDSIMPYTNYTFDFKGIIDYIFCSKQHMTVMGLLGPVDMEWLEKNKIVGCPHPHIPSDHFSLLAEIELSAVYANSPQNNNSVNNSGSNNNNSSGVQQSNSVAFSR